MGDADEMNERIGGRDVGGVGFGAQRVTVNDLASRRNARFRARRGPGRRTRWPRRSNSAARLEPRNPVAPVRKICCGGMVTSVQTLIRTRDCNGFAATTATLRAGLRSSRDGEVISAASSLAGRTRAEASNSDSPISPNRALTTNAGRGKTAGRWSAAPRARTNSRLRTGCGATAFTGPESLSSVSANRNAPTTSSSVIQLMYWRPSPTGPPRPSRNAGSMARKRAAIFAQHDADAKVHHANSSGSGGSRGIFPLLADVSEKALAGRAVFGQFFVAAIAVVADRRGRYENSRIAGLAKRLGSGSCQGSSALHAALAHLALELLRPAAGDVFAGEMHDGVEVVRALADRAVRAGSHCT